MNTIHYSCSRHKDGQIHPSQRKMSPSEAFSLIAEYEFGFSAKILAISETELTVETDVFGCVDVTMVSGTVEDMAPLIRLARHRAVIAEERSGKSQAIRLKDAEAEKAFNQLHASICGGTSNTRGLLIALLHEDFGLDLSSLGTLYLRDLVALAVMGWYEGVTKEDLGLLVA